MPNAPIQFLLFAVAKLQAEGYSEEKITEYLARQGYSTPESLQRLMVEGQALAQTRDPVAIQQSEDLEEAYQMSQNPQYLSPESLKVINNTIGKKERPDAVGRDIPDDATTVNRA